ncbi:MAG: hypothetical protein LBH85_02760 [Treponema sp.]|jgi:flagellar basal body-associated protein FliL|nr:hypothetical protein [Treponema sp.]
MALVESALKSSLLSLFNQMKQSEMSEENFAGNMAKIINDHIKTATVTVKEGIPVSTSGGAGATSGTGSGSLS